MSVQQSEGSVASVVIPRQRQAGVRPAQRLLGRDRESERLLGLVEAARSGRGSVLVVRGDAGIGKTALLDHLAGTVQGCRVLRVAGAESETALPFAGLHQLCASLLHLVERLPAPQADAIGTALGLRAGRPPDDMLVGLAVLGLLGEAAATGPLVCAIDDAQWLDSATRETLGFVARRVSGEPVLLLVATRPTDDARWSGLPEVEVTGLGPEHAGALLDSALVSPLDERVRTRVLAETRGNPATLLELPHQLGAAELMFGPDHVTVAPATSRLERELVREVTSLPTPSRRLLVIAATDPLGDVGVLWRAADELGIGPNALGPLERAELLQVDGLVRFRDPLLRSAAYRFATPDERRLVHRALARVTDARLDPDRQAWHHAQAATGPDEAVAAELERSAGRALVRGGVRGAAAFLARAAELTPEPRQRARREVDAAQAMLQAGAFEAASRLLAAARLGPLTQLQQACVNVVAAQIGFAESRGSATFPPLLTAARHLGPLDARRALDSYVDAFSAALFAGRLATGPGVVDVALAVREVPTPAHLRRGDVLLRGVAGLFVDGYPAAVPRLREAVRAFESRDLTIDEGLRFLWLATIVAADLWNLESWDRLADRHLDVARVSGSLVALPLALNTRTFVELFAGDLDAASAHVAEIGRLADVTGAESTPWAAMGLVALRGHEQEAEPFLARVMEDVLARGEGLGVSCTHWAQALLRNGLGRYAAALDAARVAAAQPLEMAVANWALSELVEAAARAHEPAEATAALDQLSLKTRAAGTDWALGVEARCRAMLHSGDRAEALYLEAIDRLTRAHVEVELARAHLLYGEWLRREGHRVQARDQLRVAHQSLSAMGVDAFAARARRELAATGETVRKRNEETQRDLTPQELHIARLAAEGLTNPEIGAALFISPRTVEWHLGKVYAKLGISARTHLGRILGEEHPD